EHGLQDVPNVGPRDFEGFPQRPGMFASPDRQIGVVIYRDELRPPIQDDGEARIEADADGGPQALRPVGRRAQRRGGEVERPHERAHFTAAAQKVVAGLVLIRHGYRTSATPFPFVTWPSRTSRMVR